MNEITEERLERMRAICGFGPGFCKCGCGERTGRDSYRKGHHRRGAGKGWYIHSSGYMMVMSPGHPRASKGFVLEHIIVMEEFLGRRIQQGESIHHIDGNRRNNQLNNLMLFDSEAEHQEYERRYRAYISCGHWDWIKCVYCHEYDRLDHSKMIRQGSGYSHKSCRREYDRQRGR